MSALKPRIFLNGLLLIATLVGIAYLFEVTSLSSMLDKGWIDSEVRGKGMAGELLFLGMGAVATAIGAPRQAISFLAGYAFDLAWGTALGVTATVGGCVISFFYARWFGRSLVAARFPDRIQRIEDFIRDNTFSMTLLIRLLPMGSNLVTNLAAGVTRVRAVPFVLGSALGYIPQTLVFALVGSGISLDPLFRIGLGVALFLISGVLGIYLFRKFRHGRHLDAQLEHELGVDD
ncbi:MAG: TVP38/TMEM64 family protein [Gammaproteobacteria bacterium]|nr:TVP38/TMEM64 family protein [Gammaproteobacteria bacterium]